jgi:hypothetical protein
MKSRYIILPEADELAAAVFECEAAAARCETAAKTTLLFVNIVLNTIIFPHQSMDSRP